MENPKHKDYIKASRATLKLTQTGLGEKLGVSSKAIQSWEYGERNPSQTALKMIDLLLKGVVL